MCTDWEIYQQILFHVLSNAVKYSLNGQKVVIEFNFVVKEESDPEQEEQKEMPPLNPLKNFIETKITNIGPDFTNKNRRNFRTFAFQKLGVALNQN